MVEVFESSQRSSQITSRDGDNHDSSNDDSDSNSSNSGSNSNSSNSGSNSNSSNDGSNSNSGGNGSSDDSDSDDSDDDDCDKSSNNSNNKQSCFLCIYDNDPRVHYDGGWKLSQTNHCTTETTHSTTSPGSVVSLSFNGSGIVVFGTVPDSNSTNPPPTAAYMLDAAPPYVTTEPEASKDISMQPLFAAAQLSDHEHTLIINVTSVTGAPFTLEYFFIFPNSNLTQDAVGSSASFPAPSVIKPTSSSSTSTATATFGALQDYQNSINVVNVLKIMTALLGSFVVLLVFMVCFLLFRLKRRGVPQHFHTSPPYSSKSNTIFTSTDSIERNHPAAMWTDSDYTRSTRTGISYISSDPVPPSIIASLKRSTPSEKSYV